MSIPAPLTLHREAVQTEWIDYNGHMNVAYYVLAFDHATDALFDFLEVGETYRRAAGCSFFTVRQNIDYVREVHAGEMLSFETHFLGCDDKRLHFHHAMYHLQKGYLAATTEVLVLHVNLAARRAAPMPDEARSRAEALAAAHIVLPEPEGLGRRIGLKKA